MVAAKEMLIVLRTAEKQTAPFAFQFKRNLISVCLASIESQMYRHKHFKETSPFGKTIALSEQHCRQHLACQVHKEVVDIVADLVRETSTRTGRPDTSAATHQAEQAYEDSHAQDAS